jgi:hypothetical protein
VLLIIISALSLLDVMLLVTKIVYCLWKVKKNMSMERWWDDTDREKPKLFGGGGGLGTCPTRTLFTTNPAWTDLASKIGIHSVARLVTDNMSHGIASHHCGVIDDGSVNISMISLSHLLWENRNLVLQKFYVVTLYNSSLCRHKHWRTCYCLL